MLVTSNTQLKILRDNGKIHREVFDVVRANHLRVGSTGQEIESVAKEILMKHNATSAFLGQYGYPANVIVSINDTVVHGVPTHEPFEDGDVVTIDFGVKKDKLLTDAAFTIIIGTPQDPSHTKLIETAQKALQLGMKQARTGKATGDIGHAIYEHVTKSGFHIVKELTGHGLGTSIHERPNIYNFGKAGRGAVLGDGQYIAIEPIVGLTTGEISEGENFSILMKDGNIGVQEEHCGIVRDDVFEIIV